jgi:hypothetical protein
MKLNFWQWVGLAVLVVGVAALVYRESHPAAPKTPTTQNLGTAPVVQPTR